MKSLVLSAERKAESDLAERIERGRSFHTAGPADESALSPKDFEVRCSESVRGSEDERSVRAWVLMGRSSER